MAAPAGGAQQWSRTTAKLNGRCAKFNLLRNLCCATSLRAMAAPPRFFWQTFFEPTCAI
jgi:hypothetical protein